MYYNEKQIINEFFKDIREFKNKVLAKTNNKFKISFIKYIKNENGENINTKRFTLPKNFIGKNLDKVIFNNKIYYKNKYKFENIYISIDENDNKTNLLWLDDIKIENFTAEQLQYITLIETSPNNYQGYIILDREISKDELKEIKKYFHKKYNTDIGSIDFTHLMRLPFFYSYKHEQPHYINIKQYQKKLLNIQPILEKIKINKEKETHTQTQTINKLNNINESEIKKFYDKYFNEKMKDKEISPDYNIIDFRFLHYLYYFTNIDITGINWENILFNINERKKGHITDYINRTINKIINIKDYYNNKDYKNPDTHLLQQIIKAGN